LTRAIAFELKVRRSSWVTGCPVIFAGPARELLTTACKYGALSDAERRIEISWKLDRHDGKDFPVSQWRETGGPPVVDPSRKGFGSRLIASSLNAYGQVHLAYEPQGLLLTIDMPLSKFQFRNDLAQIDR
jgi:two-component sensor histidine kinase